MAPDVLKLGKPVMIGGTDPDLTHMGNQWLFRFRPNDSYSGRVIADYGVNTLGKKKWAIVHSTDAFGTAGGKALTDALEQARRAAGARSGLCQPEPGFHAGGAGGEAVRRRRARHLLHLRKRSRHFRPPVAPARRQHSLGRFAFGRSTVSSTKLAGPALYGTYGVADYAEDSSEASKAFGKAYRDAYKIAPDNQSAWPYDAITILAAAINKAGSTDPGKDPRGDPRHQEICPAPKANIISTRTATVCTATTS